MSSKREVLVTANGVQPSSRALDEVAGAALKSLYFEDADRPPLSYYEKNKSLEPKIHTPGGKTIIAKEWVKAPEFVPKQGSQGPVTAPSLAGACELVQARPDHDGNSLVIRNAHGQVEYSGAPNTNPTYSQSRQGASMECQYQVPMDPRVHRPLTSQPSFLPVQMRPNIPVPLHGNMMPPGAIWPPQGIAMNMGHMGQAMHPSMALQQMLRPGMRMPMNMRHPGAGALMSVPGPQLHQRLMQRGPLMLPLGYTANMTTINAASGHQIPAIVLKKRRKKKSRRTRTQPLGQTLEKTGSETGSTATDRAPTDPSLSQPNGLESGDSSTAQLVVSETTTEQSSRRSEPDLTKVGNSRVSRANSLSEADPNGVILTASCPDLTDAQWELVDEFWMPYQSTMLESQLDQLRNDPNGQQVDPTENNVLLMKSTINQQPSQLDDEFDFSGAVFSAFEDNNNNAPHLGNLDNEREMSHEGSDEERVYQRLIDDTRLKRSVDTQRQLQVHQSPRSLLQELEDDAKAATRSAMKTDYYRQTYNVTDDEVFDNIHITGNPLSEEVDCVVASQPNSFNFTPNRLFRSGSDGMLPKFQPPKQEVCCVVM